MHKYFSGCVRTDTAEYITSSPRKCANIDNSSQQIKDIGCAAGVTAHIVEMDLTN